MLDKKADKAILAPRDVIQVAFALMRRTLLRWKLILVAVILGVFAAAVAPKLLPPVYSSETLVLYQEVIQTDNLLGAHQYATESRRQMGMRLREMLLSRTNLEQIIAEHNLYPSIVQGRGIVDAVEEFRAQIDCRVRENETFRIVYQSDDPDQVFEVTKALTNSLVEQNRQYRTEKAEATKQFLTAEQRRMATDLAEKEQRLAEFLANHPEFAQDAATSASATGASVRAAARTGSSEESALVAIDRQLARLRAQLKSPNPVAPPPAVFLSPKAAADIAAAESALAEANRRLAAAQAKYTERHPDVAAAASEVQRATAQLNQARAAARGPSAAAAPEAPMTTTDAKERITADIRRLENQRAIVARGSAAPAEDGGEGEGSSIVALETRWASLNRELSEAREQHEQIQTRLFRASMVATVEAMGQASQMVIVDEAYRPKRPTKRGPNRTRATAVGIVFAIGASIAFGLGLIDQTVYDERDVKKLELGPIAHVVPKPKKQSRKQQKRQRNPSGQRNG